MFSELETEMKRVRVSAPTYQDLVSLYYLKKMLYNDKDLPVKENFIIFKNFCEVYKNINMNEDVEKFMKKVYTFRKKIKANGIKIEDLKKSDKPYEKSITLSLLIEVIRTLILTPFFLFFLPIKKILISIAEKKRRQALSNSVVKGTFFLS
jgi:hypothetical protein